VEAKDSLGNWQEAEASFRLVTETTDSDGDGMPDWWENLYGFDMDTRDGDMDADGDGYTNLEEYLGRDGKAGNDDSSDPTSGSSIPKGSDGEDNSGPSPAIFIMIGLGIIILAGAVFLIIRLTKRT
jgi:hypothetical protein